MKSRWERPIAAILALLAVGIYSLCCKPAWSPKGDKVAYICSLGEKEQTRWAVGIYDLSTKQSRVVAETKGEGNSKLVPIEVFWPKRGDELVYVSVPEDKDKEGAVQVSTCNLKTGAVKNSKWIPVSKVEVASGVGPVFMQGKRWLWLQSEAGCFRVDFDKGSATQLKRAKVPLNRGGEVYYAAETAEKGVEFGRVTTFFSLKERPLFTVVPEKGKTLTPLMSMPARCVRFACIVKSDAANELRIYDDKGRGLKTIRLPEKTEFGEQLPAGAEWSPDGGTVWIAMKGNDGDVPYTGLAEIHVADGTVRIIKVNVNDQLGDISPLQPSLSPSGTWLAVSMFGKDSIAGLCLVDLTNNDRKVTLAPPPEPAAPAKAAGGK